MFQRMEPISVLRTIHGGIAYSVLSTTRSLEGDPLPLSGPENAGRFPGMTIALFIFLFIYSIVFMFGTFSIVFFVCLFNM